MDYRRMGNMEQQLGNASSVNFLHQHRDLWKSPRGTVLRIQASSLVAIVLTFFLAAFGSCRRWSNRWIIQKGFLAANVLSLSLGTYSIGLMQSSSVKSEMYPIWAMSLLTLFGCVDSVTTYNGLDYKSPLSKMIFQLCLYCGYVLLMSISTISSHIGNTAIGILSIITFMKGFHMSLALVLPSKMRNEIRNNRSLERNDPIQPDKWTLTKMLIVDFPTTRYCEVIMEDIHSIREDRHVGACYDVCLAFSLSHLLQQCFIGLVDVRRLPSRFDLRESVEVGNYMRALKLIEVELAFLYETFFTGNAFLHYYEAKAASFWALASFMGICFVGIAAPIPRTMASRHTTSPGPGACAIVVGTTTADLVITLVILVSLALLQLVQLMRCWTSNWARVAFACKYARDRKNRINRPRIWWWWMRLKGLVVTRINWFDKYLWQDMLGQYSVVEGSSRRECKLFSSFGSSGGGHLYEKCARLLGILGLQYIGQILWELWGSDTNKGAAVRLHADVKASIADFLSQIKDNRIGENWSSLFAANGVDINLPYKNPGSFSQEEWFAKCFMKWHIATCYCELAEQKQEKQVKEELPEEERLEREKNRRVANALSKYCAYLATSAPELLHRGYLQSERFLDDALLEARTALDAADDKFKAMKRGPKDRLTGYEFVRTTFWPGVILGQELFQRTPFRGRRCFDDPWKVLALFWVQALLYAAPYGDVEVHMQHLSQGGEFITHLWALLYHLKIHGWEPVKDEEEISEFGKWRTNRGRRRKSRRQITEIVEEEESLEFGGWRTNRGRRRKSRRQSTEIVEEEAKPEDGSRKKRIQRTDRRGRR